MAELWFGSHPSGPASVVLNGNHVKLDAFIQKYPEMVGVIDVYHGSHKTLPYLFKILSIAEPLSLQAHPDKKLAQILHQKDPKNYPDSNHKPELAIALTEFEVLCDFRPIPELASFLKSVKPLRRLVGEENCDLYVKEHRDGDADSIKAKLSACFKALMTSNGEAIKKETLSLLENQESLKQIGSKLFKLIERLNKLYTGDPGVFAPFFLNHLTLAPGQAIYLKANKLHAYISGECIECMACSDNVVRAGLTTKFRDVDTLVKMLNYEQVAEAKAILLPATKYDHDPSVISFAPTNEFKVDKISVDGRAGSNNEYTLSPKSSGSFFVVLDGTALARDFFDVSMVHKLKLGSAAFIPPKTSLKLYNIQGSLTVYRCYC